MAQVQGPTPAKRIHDETNKILAISEVRTIMIRHTNKEGVESLTMAYVFGEANYGPVGKEERMLGIWITASGNQLRDGLRLASKNQAKNIISILEEKGFIVDGKLSTPAAPPLPDVSGAFDDETEESETEKG